MLPKLLQIECNSFRTVCLYCRRELFQKIQYLAQIPADEVEELIHELRFLHFGDIDDCAFAGAFYPPGLCVRAAAAGEYQQAGVRPFLGIQIALELQL